MSTEPDDARQPAAAPVGKGETPTPETDCRTFEAKEYPLTEKNDTFVVVLASFARTLERQRDQWKKSAETMQDSLREAREQVKALTQQRDEAVKERECVHQCWDEILALLGYEKGKGYPGIVESVRAAIASREAEIACLR